MFLSNKFFLLIIASFLVLNSCKKDDDEATVEDRDYTEQYVLEEQLIEDYLKTHFYNYKDFEKVNPNNLEITLDSIYGENSNRTPLYDQIIKKKVPVIDKNGVEVDHNLYYLLAKSGLGQKPSNVDSAYVSYEGSLLNGKVFDQRKVPVWFDLAALIKGFRFGISEFQSGEYSVNNDGTISFSNYSMGLLFIPSGLAYFSSAQTDIPEYSPLIFKISLFTINESDHDFDGILSKNEDINKDGDPLNDDSNGNSIPDMYDNDDDGDGILTKNEYDQNQDGIPDDSDSDLIPDYLDTEG